MEIIGTNRASRTRQLLLTALLAAASTLAGAAPEIGKPAPAFAVRDSNGQMQTLADHLGKVVVLEWTNADCPFVRKHYGVNNGGVVDNGGANNMQTLQKRYTDKGVVWLSVISSAKGKQGHLSGADVNQLTKERNAAPTAVLLDESGGMGRAYDARTTPHMYVIDINGLLAYTGGIDSIPSADVEDIAKATPYLADAADAVLAGKPVAEPVTKPYGCSVKY